MIDALDRLDQRYAGWLRSRPELGFLAIGLVFVAATGFHAARFEPAPPTAPVETIAPTPEAGDAGTSVLVGPQPEEDLDAYVQHRFAELGELADSDPGVTAHAIVSLDDYRTPADAAALLEGTSVQVYAARYRLRAAASDSVAEDSDPLASGQVGVPGDLQDAVLAALEREADQARLHAGELEQMAATTDDPEFAETFLRDMEALLAAADAAGPGCVCVYALLIQGTHADLVELALRAGVRLVDPAPPGADPDTLIFLGIPPGS